MLGTGPRSKIPKPVTVIPSLTRQNVTRKLVQRFVILKLRVRRFSATVRARRSRVTLTVTLWRRVLSLDKLRFLTLSSPRKCIIVLSRPIPFGLIQLFRVIILVPRPIWLPALKPLVSLAVFIALNMVLRTRRRNRRVWNQIKLFKVLIGVMLRIQLKISLVMLLMTLVTLIVPIVFQRLRRGVKGVGNRFRIAPVVRSLLLVQTRRNIVTRLSIRVGGH